MSTSLTPQSPLATLEPDMKRPRLTGCTDHEQPDDSKMREAVREWISSLKRLEEVLVAMLY